MPSKSGEHAELQQRLAVVKTELENRIERGERCVCEDLLTLHAELRADPECVLELAYAEFAALDLLGKNPDPHDYFRRFPELQERFSLVLKIHGAFTDERAEEAAFSAWPWLEAADAADESPDVCVTSDKRIGQYEILDEIGRGGMGIVFKARQIGLNRIVALKIIRSPLATREEVCRFRREALAAAKLEHPNIVAVHEISHQLGFPYFSFEFVGGGSLAERVAERPIKATDAAAFIETLARAVAYAHSLGVVHRDLKPANILLTTDGQPKITDFGLAKLLTYAGDEDENQLQVTRTGAVLGTPCYMSPEQVSGHPGSVGPATDIYALGVIFYEMLTGRPPFQGESTIETFEQIRHFEPASPRRLRPQLPRDYETICLKCLEKEPPRRYRSATALADDLARALAGRPIVARPVRLHERCAKWLYRQPAIAALIAVVVAVSIAGATGVILQWRRAEEGWRRAEIVLRQVERARHSEAAQRKETQHNLYRHLIATAHRDLLTHRFRQSEWVLDQCSKEFRHWEWYYLKRLCHPEQMTLARHSQAARRAKYFPEGRQIATATGDWGTGRPGRLQVFDAVNGAVNWGIDVAAGPVMDLAISPDGKLIATACVNFEQPTQQGVTIWDAQSGEAIRHLPPDIGNAFSVAFSHDGQILATGGSDGQLRLFRPGTGEAVRVFTGHTDNVHSVVFSPDDTVVASASRDATVRMWLVHEGTPQRVLPCDNDQRSVTFSPDGRLIATAGYGGVARLWRLDQTPAEPLYLRVDAGLVRGLSFSPNGELLAGVDEKGAVYLWEVSSGRLAATLFGHDAFGNQTAFSPDGSRLVSASGDGTVKIWDVDAEHISAVRAGSRTVTDGGWISELAYSPNGQMLAIASDTNPVNRDLVDNTIRLMDTTTFKERRRLKGHAQGVTCLAFSSDGAQLASGGRDHVVRAWNVATGEIMWTAAGHSAAVNDLVFLENKLYSAGEDGLLIAWDAAAGGRPLGQWQMPAPITYLEVVNNPIVALLNSAGEIHLWNASTHRVLPTVIRVEGAVGVMRSRPDGKRIAIATGNDIQIWDTSSLPARGPVRTNILKGHTARVSGLTYSVDGKRLISIAQDKNVKLWDDDASAEMLTLQTPSEDTLSVAIHPECRQLVIASHGSVVYWDTAPWRCGDSVSPTFFMFPANGEQADWHDGVDSTN